MHETNNLLCTRAFHVLVCLLVCLLISVECFAQEEPSISDDDLIKQAQVLLSETRSPELESLCDKIIVQSPDHPIALALRAKARVRIGKSEQAKRDIERALEISQNDARVICLASLVATCCFEFDTAVELADEAIALSPKSPNGYIEKANAYYRASYGGKGLASIDRAIELDPTNARACYIKAIILQQFGSRKASQDWLRKSIALNPRYIHALIWEGFLENRSMSVFDEILKINPKSPIALSLGAVTLASSSTLQENWDKALADARLARSLAPLDPEIHYLLGSVYFFRNEHDLAKQCYLKAIELSPTDADRLVRVADQLESRGDTETANSLLLKAKQLQPKSPQPYLQQVSFLTDQEHYQAASEVLEDIAKLMSDTLLPNEFYKKRAYVRLHLRKHKQAIEDYTKLISIDPTNGFNFYCRGIAHQRSGNKEAATVDHKQAKKLGYYVRGGIL